MSTAVWICLLGVIAFAFVATFIDNWLRERSYRRDEERIREIGRLNR